VHPIRDEETRALIEESKRVRRELAAAVADLDRYVAALQAYLGQSPSTDRDAEQQ
jgi:hypothetical protein